MEKRALQTYPPFSIDPALAPRRKPQGTQIMTTTETVADVLAEIRTRPYGRLSRAQIHSLADRIESALASAEPVAFDPPCKMVATLLTWMLGKWENGTPVTEEQARDILAKIFAHAQPAAKVEAPRKVFPPAAFEEWFADIWAGTDGIPVPPYQGDGWDAYIEKRQLALGAWVAATESAPTPASDYPECSGDPASCPENEGHGCCKPNPVKTPASVPAVFREHGNSALAHISNALDDLESSRDQRPVPLLNEAMFHIHAMLTTPEPRNADQ